MSPFKARAFFVAKGSNGGVTYTRAGDFSIDKSGLLENRRWRGKSWGTWR